MITDEEEKTKEEIKKENANTNNFEEVQTYQEVEIKKKPVRTDSYFDGGLLELIGWRILAFLITAITFGIGAPWAKCMLYSYEIKHTVYNGKRLKFEGTGGDLFVNIFKWIVFSIITLGIYIFVIPVKKAKWVISNIHFEDEEFNKDESFFDGNTLQFIGVNILCNILNIISFGLLFTFTTCFKLRWINKHTVINRKRIVFSGKALPLFGKYLLWTFLTMITFGIYGLWLPIKVLKWRTKNTHIKTVGEVEKKDNSMIAAIAIAIVAILVIGPSVPAIISGIENSKFISSIEKNIDLPFLSNDIKSKTKNKTKTSTKSKTTNNKKTATSTNYKTTKSTSKAKTSTTIGGYTLKFGKYTGTIEQYDWIDQKLIKHKVTLVLSEKSIRLDGKTGSYSNSGTRIIWRGDSNLLEVVGNNKIRYNVETCPVLKYQGK